MVLVLPEPVHQSNGQGKERRGSSKSLDGTHYTNSGKPMCGQGWNGIENGNFELWILSNGLEIEEER